MHGNNSDDSEAFPSITGETDHFITEAVYKELKCSDQEEEEENHHF